MKLITGTQIDITVKGHQPGAHFDLLVSGRVTIEDPITATELRRALREQMAEQWATEGETDYPVEWVKITRFEIITAE
jgi:hypothetical protein